MPREVDSSVLFQREAPTWYAHLQLNRDYAVGNTFCKKDIFQAPQSSLKTIKQPRAATASSASAMTEMAATLAKGERVFEKILKIVFEARM